MFEIRRTAKAREYIGFKLTEAERRALERYAEARAMSLSDFARLAIGTGIRQMEESEGVNFDDHERGAQNDNASTRL